MPARPSLLSLSRCIGLCAAVLAPVTAHAQGLFLTPIPNVQFSAVVRGDRTTIHKDGTVIQYRSVRTIARDSHGRIHNEITSFIPVTSTDTPKLINIHLYDPQTRVSTELDVLKHTFWTQTVNHPPSTEPPSIRYAAPDGNAPPNEFVHQEDLGLRDIEGVQAHGIRQTQTITDDTGRQISVTDETWYSQDLRVNLIFKHNDPRTGSTTLTVTQITRTEPDPALFEVPEGYTRAGAQSGTR